MVSAAFGLRLLVIGSVLAHSGPQWFFSRGMEMGAIADSLVRGHGFGSPFGPATGPTALIAPGYPLFTAAVFRVFGVGTVGAATVIMLLQAILNTLTAYLILRLGRHLGEERSATCAALLWSCSPPLLWIPTIFWETSFSSLLLLGSVALTWRFAPKHSAIGSWILRGACCAVATLINPALLPSLLVLGAWSIARTASGVLRKPPAASAGHHHKRMPLFLVRTVLTAPLIGTAVFLALYAPWPLRNARVFHACILTRTTIGYELWMGNRPGADGFLNQALFPTFNPKELAQYRSEGELHYTRIKANAARSWIVSHPPAFLGLTARRVARFWMGIGSRPASAAFLLHAALTTLLGSWGAVRLLQERRWEATVPFLLPLLVFPLPYYFTHAEFRYRLVVDPLLTTLAVAALRGRRNQSQEKREESEAVILTLPSVRRELLQ